MISPKSIEEAAYMVAFNFQLKSINDGKGPLEAFATINIALPHNFPDDWRACDFMSLVNLTKENNDE